MSNQVDSNLWFIHKYEVWQEYGGPEEGGWWWEQGAPLDLSEWHPEVFTSEDSAWERARDLNDEEYERRKREEDYGWGMALSDGCTFYTYRVEDSLWPSEYPVPRPHYC
jgi:hypothetical protein